jgi:hypothetical protein
MAVGRHTDMTLFDRPAKSEELRPSAAKDRTFKTVRPNQGTASGTVPIRRRPSL